MGQSSEATVNIKRSINVQITGPDGKDIVLAGEALAGRRIVSGAVFGERLMRTTHQRRFDLIRSELGIALDQQSGCTTDDRGRHGRSAQLEIR